MSDVTTIIMKAMKENRHYETVLNDVVKGFGNCGFFQVVNWKEIIETNFNATVYAKASLELIGRTIANKNIDSIKVLHDVAQKFTTPGFFFTPDTSAILTVNPADNCETDRNTIYIKSPNSINMSVHNHENNLEIQKKNTETSTQSTVNTDVLKKTGKRKMRRSNCLSKRRRTIDLSTFRSNSPSFIRSPSNNNFNRNHKENSKDSPERDTETVSVHVNTQRESIFIITEPKQYRSADSSAQVSEAIEDEKLNEDLGFVISINNIWNESSSFEALPANIKVPLDDLWAPSTDSNVNESHKFNIASEDIHHSITGSSIVHKDDVACSQEFEFERPLILENSHTNYFPSEYNAYTPVKFVAKPEDFPTQMLQDLNDKDKLFSCEVRLKNCLRNRFCN